VEVNDAGYAPATISIIRDGTIEWRWTGVLPHSATSDPGQAESFNSGSRLSGTFRHQFRKAGTYTYGSTNDPGWEGTIIVKPYPGDPPRIRRLRVLHPEDPRAKFRLNKRADVVGRIKHRSDGSWETVKTFFRFVTRGRTRLNLPMGGLDSGHYRLRLRAYDVYGRRDSDASRFRFG
jgi:hypothetical protein